MQTYLKSKPVWAQLLLFLGLSFGLFLVLSFIGIAILSSLTGVSIFQLQDIDKWDTSNPNLITFIRGTLLVQFLGLFLIPTLLFAYFSDPKPARYLGLKAPQDPLYWILGILVMVAAIPMVEYSGWINQQLIPAGSQKWMKALEEEAAKQIQFMLKKHTLGELFKNLIFISLFAGIGEELFFRGVLQRLFIRATRSPWVGIVIAAALFSAFHFQFFGFIPRLLLGILLGVIYWYSGSLWPSIIAHFAYDALIIVLAYFNPSMLENPDATLMKPGQMLPMALISTVLTALLVWHMMRRSKASFEAVYRDDLKPQNPFSF
ncbi:MAG TPA: CPBP family intramembrane glutamic endopeptidase [Flavisolibacter sp.]|jgi:hypothetical protein|nr:CPBP family intramembrane glutamic endopeptidase [Flavisolibacter sp.]